MSERFKTINVKPSKEEAKNIAKELIKRSPYARKLQGTRAFVQGVKENISNIEDTDMYSEGDIRQDIRKFTKGISEEIGQNLNEVGSTILENIPENIKEGTASIVQEGLTNVSERYQEGLEFNVENKLNPLEYVVEADAYLKARQMQAIGKGLEKVGTAWDFVMGKSSNLTGVDRSWLEVGEFFVPYSKIFKAAKFLKAAKTVDTVADTAKIVDKVVDTSKIVDKVAATSDLRGAEFAFKAQQRSPVGVTSFDDFVAELGEVQFLKKNSRTDKALQNINKTRGQVKTDKQLFFTDIYDPEFAAARKLNPKTRIPDEFAYTGAYHPTGIMTAQKRSPVLPEKLQKLFERKYAKFPGFQMAPHHFTLDDELAYSVISKVNKANQSEVVSILNDTYSVYPGNHPKNFMMSYHDNTALRYKQQITQVNNAWDDYFAKYPNATEKRPSLKQITTLQKMPSEGKMIGGKASFNRPLGETLLEEIDMMVDVRTKGLDKKKWSSILPPGVKRSDLTFDPVVLGIDHQALIHGIGDRLPSRLKLLKLSKTKKWAEMSPSAQALEIAKVSREQQNVALRISGMRLELIKKRMIELGVPINDWTDIQVWMIKNPTEAASLNYHKILSEGVDIPMDIITTDLPLEKAQEIANVFNIELVNKVGPALDANRAQVKAITQDVKKGL